MLRTLQSFKWANMIPKGSLGFDSIFFQILHPVHFLHPGKDSTVICFIYKLECKTSVYKTVFSKFMRTRQPHLHVDGQDCPQSRLCSSAWLAAPLNRVAAGC